MLTYANELPSRFDFVICGAGSSGSVVAARLAQRSDITVLLIEAGGSDDVQAVMEPARWPENLSSERDWSFRTAPEKALHERSLLLSMGKVLGGGSSINVGVWARGHKTDWDFFAAEAGDLAWNYESVLKIYKRIEAWQGAPDETRRGHDGPVYIKQQQDPHPLTVATLEAAESLGLPHYETPNGSMMEGEGGASRFESIIKDGRRQSIFRAYVQPLRKQSNLTVLTAANVTRLLLHGTKTVGVEVLHEGKLKRIAVNHEVVLSLGAFQTPRLLMQSGIGNAAHLKQFDIPVVQHLPGVGQNLQDHINFGCIWEYNKPLLPQGSGCEANIYWKSEARLVVPDLLLCQAQFPVPSPETASWGVPEHGWTMFAGVAHPKSRGTVSLTGSHFSDPLHIVTNALSDPEDLKAAEASVALTREIGNAPALRRLNTREVLPRDFDVGSHFAKLHFYIERSTSRTSDVSASPGNRKS